MKGIQIIGAITETFLAQKFENVELAGTVAASEEKEINYVSIDLENFNDWDKKADELVREIVEHLRSTVTEKNAPEPFYRKYNNITFNVRQHELEDYNKNWHVFYLPDYYDEIPSKKEKSRLSKLKENIWVVPSVATFLSVLIIFLISLVQSPLEAGKEWSLAKEINQKITFVTGIFGTFIMTFLMTRVLNLRQEKLKRAIAIRTLCEKTSLFRKICYHLLNDYRFWNDSTDYKYAQSIRKKISYSDARFVDYENDVKYNHYKALFPVEKPCTATIFLYLQLWSFAKMHTLKNLNLLYTNHPPMYIYSLDEINEFLVFTEYNEIWNLLDHNSYQAQYNTQTTHAKNIIDAAKRFDPSKFRDAEYNRQLLLDISDDVQHDVLPNLYYLLKLNEAKLPLSINYYFYSAVLIIFFSVIYPVIISLFFSKPWLLNFGSILLLGIFLHILLMLRKFLTVENTLERPGDYR